MNISAEGRRVVLLGGVALVLGGYVYMTSPEEQPFGLQAGAEAERPVFPILVLSQERVTRVELLFEGQRVVCQRVPEGWQLFPGEELLHAGAADDFLDNLKRLVNLGEIEGGAGRLYEYGLQPPSARISLRVTGATTRTLALGCRCRVQLPRLRPSAGPVGA